MSDRNLMRQKRRYRKLCERHPEAMHALRESRGGTKAAIVAVALRDEINRLKHPPLPVKISGGETGHNPPAKRRGETFTAFPLIGLLLRGRARRAS